MKNEAQFYDKYDKKSLDKKGKFSTLRAMENNRSLWEKIRNVKPLKETPKAFKAIRLAALISLAVSFSQNLSAQSTSGIDYSQESNIIDHDTLKGDQKAIFWHFVELTSKEVMATTPEKLKAEFNSLGLTPEERQRFFEAYKFYSLTMEYHKKSCENWDDFKYLDPRNND